MRKLIGTITIATALFAVTGLYRGWLSISSYEQRGVTNFSLKIDKEKIKEDTQKAGEKAKVLGEKLEESLRE